MIFFLDLMKRPCRFSPFLLMFLRCGSPRARVRSPPRGRSSAGAAVEGHYFFWLALLLPQYLLRHLRPLLHVGARRLKFLVPWVSSSPHACTGQLMCNTPMKMANRVSSLFICMICLLFAREDGASTRSAGSG
jgi:hypothetical protein